MIKKLVIHFFSLILCFSLTNIAVAEEDLPIPLPLSRLKILGRLEGEGMHFQLKDSNYLNITLDSTEPIKLILESVPEMITFHIESISSAASTQITLSGFLPLTTYYKYEDNYHNLKTFTTDNRGGYIYTQDLLKPHFVFIQPYPSTIFLTEEGWSEPWMGSWDPITRVATLTTDLNQSIQIDLDNITLNGNGHTITGNNTGYGIYLLQRTGVTIRNLNLRQFSYGIYLSESSNNIIINNTLSSNQADGVFLFESSNNTILDNNINENFCGIRLESILLLSSKNNTILGNNVNNNEFGMFLSSSHNNTLINNQLNSNSIGISVFDSNNNKIYLNDFINNTSNAYSDISNNLWDSSQPIAYSYNGNEYTNKLGNYWSDYPGLDENGDGIGDITYGIEEGEKDDYPLMQSFENYILIPTTESIMYETISSTHILSEDILSQNATLTASVTGDLRGSLNFIGFEIILINSGSFEGKGFSKGDCSANLEGISYEGSWQGMLFKKPQERKIYLKGMVSGGLKGIIEGYLTESIAGSGVYDQYQAAWTINQMGAEITFAKLDLKGMLNYQETVEYPSEELYVLQTSIDGEAAGYYKGSLSTILTHIRINNKTNPYYGQGFSIISYVSQTGEGESWSYDKVVIPGKVALTGLSTSPLLGIVSGILDEAELPRKLLLTIERIDSGLPPAPDLKVKVWGPQRVSPGQTIDYIIEYRNAGLKASDETLLFVALDYNLKYISASEGAFYNDILNTVDWNLGNLPPKSSGFLTLQAEVAWGLPEGTTLETNAIINELSSHSEKKGVFVNGIGLYKGKERDKDYAGTCENFASSRDLEWVEAYNTGSGPGDVFAVIDATNGIATEHNGLKSDLLINKEYERAEGYSGGTRTVVTAIEMYGLKVKELVLISPVNIMTIELDALQSVYGVEKIVIYQSEKDRLRFGDLYQVKISKDDPLRNQPWLEVRDRDYVHTAWLQELNNENNKNKENMSDLTPSAITPARDPNIKYGPEGDVLPGQKLNYKIEYENEGEGIAFGVYFTDTLDEDLNDSTLSIGPVIDIKTGQKIAEPGIYNPQTRTITWFVGEVASKQGGYAKFSLDVKGDAPDKAKVINFATVYFPSVPEATRTNGVVNRVTTAVDNIPPTTTATISPSPNQANWNNTDVTVNLSVTDNEDGSGVKEIHYRLTGAETKEETIFGQTAQVIISTEGLTTLAYWAIDNAGNVETQKTLEIKIDKTPPTIIATTSPQPNANGWNNSDVSVTFTATDDLSGVATVTEPITVTTEGKDQHIGGEALDLAGNRATTYAILNIDKTPPTINITANPSILWPPNHKMVDVTIGGSADDNLSSIISTMFTVEDEYNTVEPTISGFGSIIRLEAWRNGNDLNGRLYTISVTTKDRADNQATSLTTVLCPHDQRKK